MFGAVNWGTTATTAGAVATVVALVVGPILLWVRKRGHSWLADLVEEASERVIDRMVVPRLVKVEDSVHKLRGNIGEIAGRVSYLEGLEAGLLADRTEMPHARTRQARTPRHHEDEP